LAEYQIGMQIEAEHMQNLFGSHDAYIKQIEDDLHVIITDRNGEVRISGEQADVDKAAKLIRELVELSRRGNRYPVSSPGEETGYRSRTYRMRWSFREPGMRMRFWRSIRSVSVTRYRESPSSQRLWGRKNTSMLSGIR